MATPPPATGGGTDSPDPGLQPWSTTTYAAATRSSPSTYAAAVIKPTPTPRLTPVPLANRPISYLENMSAIILTQLEEEQLCKQWDNTIIMKFSTGRPKLPKIRAHIAQHWNLDSPPAVGFLDLCHATLHMGSVMDKKQVLACSSNKMNNNLFRLFRWNPEFEIGKDGTYMLFG